jgi:hypothetical protein
LIGKCHASLLVIWGRKGLFTYANEQDLSLRDFDCARLDAFRNCRAVLKSEKFGNGVGLLHLIPQQAWFVCISVKRRDCFPFGSGF